MNASEANTLSKKNSKVPVDVLKSIKKAAQEGYTFIRFNSEKRVLSTLDVNALKLSGYSVKITRPDMYQSKPIVYSITWG